MSIKKYVCNECNKVFERNEGQVWSKDVYCSKGCHQQYQSNKFDDIIRTKNKLRNKKIVMAGGKCEVCNRNDVILDTHHIDGSGDWVNWENSNNDIKNLMILCKSCHIKIHRNTKDNLYN